MSVRMAGARGPQWKNGVPNYRMAHDRMWKASPPTRCDFLEDGSCSGALTFALRKDSGTLWDYAAKCWYSQDRIDYWTLCSLHHKRYDLKKANCLRGHPMSGTNLYTSPRGRMVCRACARWRWQEYYAINKEAMKAKRRHS